MMDLAVRVNRWLAAHKRLVAIVTWTCFAVVCADYAGFVELPAILLVPFWAGVVLNVLRWAVWEGHVKPIVLARADEADAAEGVPLQEGSERARRRRLRRNRQDMPDQS